MENVRYGVIGTGMMGVEHIHNIAAMTGAEVTAIADSHEPSLDSGVEAHGDPDLPAFDDHHQLIASDLCDAVVVATPNMTHVDVLRDLMKTDLHVLVEKPLCTTVEDCRTIVEAQECRDAITWVGLEYRYIPSIARLVNEVDAGSIGALKMLAIREHRFPFLEKVDDWNRFNANTGGTMVEKCCHYFDLMNRIIGTEPVRVYASGSQAVNHIDEVYDGQRSDILDNAYVVIDYAGGERAMLDLCMFAEAGRNQEEVVAVGDLGKAEAFNPSGEFTIGIRGESWFSPDVSVETDDRIAYEGLHHGASYLEHLDFLSAIRNGTEPEISLQDGLKAVAMGVAAQRSIGSNVPVLLADVL